jgi:hypothetical protein
VAKILETFQAGAESGFDFLFGFAIAIEAE